MKLLILFGDGGFPPNPCPGICGGGGLPDDPTPGQKLKKVKKWINQMKANQVF